MRSQTIFGFFSLENGQVLWVHGGFGGSSEARVALTNSKINYRAFFDFFDQEIVPKKVIFYSKLNYCPKNFDCAIFLKNIMSGSSCPI